MLVKVEINRPAKNMLRQLDPSVPVLPPVLKAILDWELRRKPLAELDEPWKALGG